MQLLLQLPDKIDDVAIADAAASRGIGVRALSPLHLTPSHERGLLLGYGRLSESRIEDAVGALSSRDRGGGSGPLATPFRLEA